MSRLHFRCVDVPYCLETPNKYAPHRCENHPCAIPLLSHMGETVHLHALYLFFIILYHLMLSLPAGTRTRFWRRTGRSFECFSPSSPGSAKSREWSWLKSIHGSNSMPSHRKQTHRYRHESLTVNIFVFVSCDRVFNALLSLSGLCELQLRCRHVPPHSPSCT